MIDCPKCDEPIREEASTCPHCGAVKVGNRWAGGEEVHDALRGDGVEAALAEFSQNELQAKMLLELERANKHLRNISAILTIVFLLWIIGAVLVFANTTLGKSTTPTTFCTVSARQAFLC